MMSVCLATVPDLSLQNGHSSVAQVLGFFAELQLRTFVDGTLGAGGHASALLAAHPVRSSGPPQSDGDVTLIVIRSLKLKLLGIGSRHMRLRCTVAGRSPSRSRTAVWLLSRCWYC